MSNATMSIIQENHSKESKESKDISGIVRSVPRDAIEVVEKQCLLSLISIQLPRVNFN